MHFHCHTELLAGSRGGGEQSNAKMLRFVPTHVALQTINVHSQTNLLPAEHVMASHSDRGMLQAMLMFCVGTVSMASATRNLVAFWPFDRVGLNHSISRDLP